MTRSKSKQASSNILNTNFNMTNRLEPAVDIMLINDFPPAAAVYEALQSIADKYDLCATTEQNLKRVTHYSVRTIRKALRVLDNRKIIKIIHTKNFRFYILNITLFYHFLDKKTRGQINNYMRFPTPTEICKADNPDIFREYRKYYKHSSNLRKQDAKSSYSIEKDYGEKHFSNKQKKHYEIISTSESTCIRRFIMTKIFRINMSKKYLTVAQYLVKRLPIRKGKTLHTTNIQIAREIKNVGNTTVYLAISNLKSDGIILHSRGRMLFNPKLLQNAKRSWSMKQNYIKMKAISESETRPNIKTPRLNKN